MIADKFMEADTLFIQLDDKVQQLAVDNPNEDANPLRTKCQDLKDTACYLKKTAEEKLNLCKYTQNLNEELESEINESKNWLQQNDDTLRTCGTLDLDTTMMTRTIHKFNVCANSISFIDNFFVNKKNNDIYLCISDQNCLFAVVITVFIRRR